MLKKLIIIFTVLFPLFCFAQSAGQILQERLSSFHTLTADFQQIIINSDGSILQKSSGKVSIQRPGKFRWEILKPIKQIIITDGKKVWIHEPDLDQVTVRDLGSSVGETPILLLTTPYVQLQKSFTITKLPTNQNLESFKLTPKNKEECFTSIILTFKNKTLYRMELFNQLDQKTIIEWGHVSKSDTFSVTD